MQNLKNIVDNHSMDFQKFFKKRLHSNINDFNTMISGYN